MSTEDATQQSAPTPQDEDDAYTASVLTSADPAPEHDNDLHQTLDARVWAERFSRRAGVDAGMALTWFANALMAGYDAGQRTAHAMPLPAEARTLTGNDAERALDDAAEACANIALQAVGVMGGEWHHLRPHLQADRYRSWRERARLIIEGARVQMLEHTKIENGGAYFVVLPSPHESNAPGWASGRQARTFAERMRAELEQAGVKAHVFLITGGEVITVDQPICGMVTRSGPRGEPLACGFSYGHHGHHSWASLPTREDLYAGESTGMAQSMAAGAPAAMRPPRPPDQKAPLRDADMVPVVATGDSHVEGSTPYSCDVCGEPTFKTFNYQGEGWLTGRTWRVCAGCATKVTELCYSSWAAKGDGDAMARVEAELARLLKLSLPAAMERP
jgi:hypothetical protein